MKWVLCIFGAIGFLPAFLIIHRLSTPPLAEVQAVLTSGILVVLVIIALTLLRMEEKL